MSRNSIAQTLRPRWLFNTGLVLLSLLSVLKLGSEFYRLIWDQGKWGAVDLLRRQGEVIRWFSGDTVYGHMLFAVYPPASLAMLWPLVGWESQELVRWLWAVLSAVCLVWLVRQIRREAACASGADRSSPAS